MIELHKMNKYLDKIGHGKAYKELKNEWDVKKQNKPSNYDYIIDDWFKELNRYLKQGSNKNDMKAFVGNLKFREKYALIKNHAFKDELTFDFILAFDSDVTKRLLTHNHDLSDCEFWEHLASIYMTSDYNKDVLQVLKQIFNTSKRKDIHCMMTQEEQQFLNSLPDEIEIHRGMSISESKKKNYGMSWSLSKKVAEFFAYEYILRINTDEERTVVTQKIPKSEVIAYLNRRQEEEILWVGKK